MMLNRFVLGVSLLVLGLALPAVAHANPPRVTQGDAMAIFEAFPNGGWADRLNGGPLEGAPADFQPDSLARISGMPAQNGRHFCALDWHVISAVAVEGNPIDGSRTNQELQLVLSQTMLAFTLDGTSLETTRSAIKRTTNPGLRGYVEAFYVAEGRLMAPADLAVGQHTLQFTGQRPGLPPNVFAPVTFFIDGPTEGTCL